MKWIEKIQFQLKNWILQTNYLNVADHFDSNWHGNGNQRVEKYQEGQESVAEIEGGIVSKTKIPMKRAVVWTPQLTADSGDETEDDQQEENQEHLNIVDMVQSR